MNAANLAIVAHATLHIAHNFMWLPVLTVVVLRSRVLVRRRWGV